MYTNYYVGISQARKIKQPTRLVNYNVRAKFK